MKKLLDEPVMIPEQEEKQPNHKVIQCMIIGLRNGPVPVSVETAQMLTSRGIIKPYRKLGQFKLQVEEENMWRALKVFARDF